MSKNKQEAINKLQTLRNIGSITAERLYSISIKTPQQMKQSNPEKLYEKLKKCSGGKLDRCVLYQFRGAVLGVPWPNCKNKEVNDGQRRIEK